MNEKKDLEQLKALSRLLDTKFSGPFGTKFGLDALIGLIPGVGDFVTSALSLFIIAQAAALGAGPSTLIRMGINVIVENVFDMIPVFGNLFDFYWKSNIRNMAILEKHMANPARETIQSRMIVGLVFVILFFILLAAGYASWLFLRTIYFWLTTRPD